MIMSRVCSATVNGEKEFVQLHICSECQSWTNPFDWEDSLDCPGCYRPAKIMEVFSGGGCAHCIACNFSLLRENS